MTKLDRLTKDLAFWQASLLASEQATALRGGEEGRVQRREIIFILEKQIMAEKQRLGAA